MLQRPSRTDVLRLAADAEVDPRTAERALREGAAAVRGITGERIAASMGRLGFRSLVDKEAA
jgi:hypothetical protein